MLTFLLAAASMTGWIGTYTTSNGASTGSSGIYAFQWDTQQGVMSRIHPAGMTTNPSFLALHPSGRYLYAVNEDASSSGTDHITAFAIGDASSSESLRAIGTVSSEGLAPCHLSIDASGKWLFVANYVSGTIAVFPIQPGGRLGPARQVVQQKGSGPVVSRQESAHAHEVVLSPDGRFLLSADLGADKILSMDLRPRPVRSRPTPERQLFCLPGMARGTWCSPGMAGRSMWSPSSHRPSSRWAGTLSEAR